MKPVTDHVPRAAPVPPRRRPVRADATLRRDAEARHRRCRLDRPALAPAARPHGHDHGRRRQRRGRARPAPPRGRSQARRAAVQSYRGGHLAAERTRYRHPRHRGIPRAHGPRHRARPLVRRPRHCAFDLRRGRTGRRPHRRVRTRDRRRRRAKPGPPPAPDGISRTAIRPVPVTPGAGPFPFRPDLGDLE